MHRTETHEFVDEPAVAIIGMTGRFPKAKNVDELWQNLRDGVGAISFFSDEELRASGVNPATFGKPNYVPARAVLDDAELFDASFFGFNPREAEIMDPQHRLFLECAWEALENAGYNSDSYEGRIGVYAGAGFNSYLLRNLPTHGEEMQASVGFYQSKFSNDKDFLATRVCYKLNLRGPGVTVLTGSSTSLVAVHMACQSLLVGESDIMLAGGVQVSPPQKAGYLYVEGGIASSDGHCRAFDAKAKGTVGGSGVAVVVLKRLEDALADGDTIHAVIRGSAINNDGSAKVGYTAPSVAGQSKVIAEALSVAGVEPEQISYVEAHGSGTILGDTVEMAALTEAFNSERRQFCAIGSIKTNIGHLSPASGVASLIKTTLALKHRLIPPSLNFEEPNPKIDFANSPFYVNSKLSVWESNGGPRRAGVSNWGIGGTNAHLILEEAPERLSEPSTKPYQLLTISAKSQAALEAATTNLADHLKRHPELELADVAYTLQIGRRPFEHRRMMVCRDVDDAVRGLETRDQKRVYGSAREPVARPVFFMLPGLGDHYVGMGAQLYEQEPVFRKHVDDCCELLRDRLGLDLREVIYPPGLESADGQLAEPSFDLRKAFKRQERPADAAGLRLNRTELAHPALFVVEYALAQTWMALGIQPQAMIGHSLGEYVAACLAGVFTLEEALTLVARRARLIQESPEGAMLAVPLAEHEVQALLGETLSLAAVNAPSLCVVAGPKDDALALEARLRGEGIVCRLMETSHAFHSKMMQPLFDSFVALFDDISLRPPRIPYISNLTGRRITDDEATDPLYWAKHMCQPVRFAEGVGELLKEESAVLLEVGPGLSLGSFARQQTAGDEASERIVIPTLRNTYERQPDFAVLLNALGKLWLAGAQVDWAGLYEGERRLRVPLPTYPFERQRFWLEPKPPTGDARAPQGLLSKQADVADWFYVPVWKETPLRAVTGDAGETEKVTRWLVFADAVGLGSKLARQLEGEGASVVVVEAGEQYARPADDLYRINPRAEADYETLMGELAGRDMLPQAVAHLWGCASQGDAPTGIEAFEESQYAGFYSLVFLARALSKQESSGQVRIGVLSNRVHDVTGEQSVCPLKATALAACKVISQEYPNVVCQSIDAALPAAGSAQEARLVERLGAELAAAASDGVIAYGGNHRWTQTFERAPTVAAEGRRRLKEHGAYLLTGGLSEMGLALAECITRVAPAKLALVSRFPFPPREEWDEWLSAHTEEEIAARKILKVRQLESLGAEVLILTADGAVRSHMEEALARVDERFAALDGVIHIPEGDSPNVFSTIQDLERDKYEQHLAPIARALFVLEEVLDGRELDFCLLQASISSVLGGVGVGVYSAANLFVDTFVQRHNNTSRAPWVSVDWDRLRLTERGQGLNLQSVAALDELTISPEEMLPVFERLLSLKSAPQVVVSTGDLHARIERWLVPHARRKDAPAASPGAAQSYARPALRSPYQAPESEAEQRIVAVWQRLLGIAEVGIYDNFFELGGHSLLGTQLVTRLREMFGVNIQLPHLFQSPTVADLAALVEDLIIAEVNSLTDNEALSLL